MKILVADDSRNSCLFLEHGLKDLDYVVDVVYDGNRAWDVLKAARESMLAVVDWIMPGIDGVELCRRVRALENPPPIYLIMLTARSESQDIVKGLEAGADDFIKKPFAISELKARVRVGGRVLALQDSLAHRVKELETAVAEIKQLQGIFPICMYCKKIRDDKNYWQQVEGYISMHTDAQFSHGICPVCYDRVMNTEFPKPGGEGEASLNI